MDLGLTEEQELLKNFARDFLTNECTEKLVRDMEGGRAGLHRRPLERHGQPRVGWG